MLNRWDDAGVRDYVSRYNDYYHGKYDSDLLTQAYATTLLGADNDLTMHGGGNTSVKKNIVDENGDERRALYVKATGTPLNAFIPEYFVAMDLDFLDGMRLRESIDDETMALEFKRRRLIPGDRLPSIESLMHATVAAKFVDHTHPAAILKIINRVGGRELLRECFGDDLAVTPCTRVGPDLAKAVSEALRSNDGCGGIVVSHHGLITWGGDAREAYKATIDTITKAEEFLAKILVNPITPPVNTISVEESRRNYELLAPAIEKSFSQALQRVGGGDFPAGQISLALLNTPDVLELVSSPDGKGIVTVPPMTPDYPMFTRILPLWLDAGEVDIGGPPEEVFSSVSKLVDRHVNNYKSTLESKGVGNAPPTDLVPQAVVHPLLGAVCFGAGGALAQRTADFTRQAFAIRRGIRETGGEYESLPEEYLFDMQYRGYQQPKKMQK